MSNWSIFLSNDNVEVKYLPSPLLLCFKIKVEFISKEIARKSEKKKSAQKRNYEQKGRQENKKSSKKEKRRRKRE